LAVLGEAIAIILAGRPKEDRPRWVTKFMFKLNERIIERAKENEDKICPICYNDLQENICKLIQCRHIYHKICIKEWYKISRNFICPNCRKIA
jgi:hypothetical protein